MKTNGYYSKALKTPTNKKEGLQNFVQLIINALEEGNRDRALYLAVDLLNDLMGDTYDSAITKTTVVEKVSKELEEKHKAELAKQQQIWFNAGREAMKTEILNKLGLTA